MARPDVQFAQMSVGNKVDMYRRSVELYFQRVSDKALSKGHRWGPIQRDDSRSVSKQSTIDIDYH